jgi:PAS domain S-box-containing protein
MIWSSGPDKRCDWFNESWLTFTGRTLEQELGDGWLEGVHPQDRERAFDVYARAFDARQPFSTEYRLRHRDGTYRRVLDEGVPRTVDGRFYGYIGSAVDVTEQRLLEEQMLHSKKMEAVGQLAGGVAHDFNNLLTIINGYTDLMLARFTREDTTRHDLEEVRIAGQRAASLTSQLLAFGRRQAMQPTVLDIDVEVAESAKTLRRVLGPDVEIAVESDGGRAQTRADRNQFAQVLLNLAVNAREAMPDGGRLTFATSVVEFGGTNAGRHPNLAPRRYVRLAISDNGRGMAPDVKARIFEPFFTTKEFGQGSGLGLSVAHGIVEQSGGHIEVESEPGRGATFFIYLPCVS